MTALAVPPLLGSQVATRELIQPGTPDFRAERLADAIGLDLLPWQRRVLGAMTARRDDHWACREALLLVPRQSGKTTVAIIRILAGMLLLGEKDVLYSAHEFLTSKSVFREMTELIKSTPLLDRELVRSWTSNGDFRLMFKNGSQLRLVARTANAGRGLHPDLIVFDEAFSVSEEVLTALIPAQAAKKDPQTLWMSSAGDDTSSELIRMRNRLHSGADRYLSAWDWFAPAEMDADDPRTWATALPSYGSLTSEDTVRQAKSTLSKVGFEREFLGRWQEAIEARIFTSEQIEAVLVPPQPAPDDPAASSLAFGVEVAQFGINRLSASVVACWLDDDGNPVCTVIKSDSGIDWLDSYLRYITSAYPGAPIAYDAKSPALDVWERISRDGEVEMTRVDWPNYSRTCAAFLQGVVDLRVKVCRQHPSLLAADMSSVKQKIVGPAWCWERLSTSPPASLIAATCALYATELADIGLPEIK